MLYGRIHALQPMMRLSTACKRLAGRTHVSPLQCKHADFDAQLCPPIQHQVLADLEDLFF